MILNIGSIVLDGLGNKYILEDIIGQGGFGYVYKAHRESDKKTYAIKTTLPSFYNKSSEESFKNEIRVALKIKGDNVIHYEYVHSGEEYPELPPYIIMEYANNGTLRDIINQRKESRLFYTEEELLRIFRQLVNGMKDVNSLLIHRDIKPENILICDSTLKISDFGLSKIAVENTRTMTFKGGGTPLYMAPEAWDYSKNTIQMDIYSMGIIFYELAALKYPYESMPRNSEEAKDMHWYSPIRNIKHVNPELAPRLVSIINRMLEKNPKRRFKDWNEIIQSLEISKRFNSVLENAVTTVVNTKNNFDLQRQKQESEQRKKEKERNDFCKLVRSQFDNTIVAVLREYVDKINLEYAGLDKTQLRYSNDIVSQQKYLSCRVAAFGNKYVDIKLEIVFKENYTQVPTKNFGRKRQYRECIPQYQGKNIIALGEISNAKGLGYNILLVDNDEIYGDWIIMKNKNNLSIMAPGTERKEPFAFSIKELPEEINMVQVTHLYRAEFVEYSDDKFLEIVNTLVLSS